MNSLQGGENIYLGHWVCLSLYKHQRTWQPTSQSVNWWESNKILLKSASEEHGLQSI